MIKTFKDRDVERILDRLSSRRYSSIQRMVLRKLLTMEAATSLSEMMQPPGTRLEALSGDRAGQHSIRVNQQYHICFVWKEHDAFDVEVVDCH